MRLLPILGLLAACSGRAKEEVEPDCYRWAEQPAGDPAPASDVSLIPVPDLGATLTAAAALSGDFVATAGDDPTGTVSLVLEPTAATVYWSCPESGDDWPWTVAVPGEATVHGCDASLTVPVELGLWDGGAWLSGDGIYASAADALWSSLRLDLDEAVADAVGVGDLDAADGCLLEDLRRP